MRYIFLIISFSLFQSALSLISLLDFMFPRHPVLHRVRKLNPEKKLGDVGVLDFIGLVEQQGYPGEEHYLTTEDKYKLTIHRIPGSARSPPKVGKPVVLLQHGLLGSSDFWALVEANISLAYMMADEGYDVWVGNIRGNSYCRSHENLSTTDPKFWRFSYHEAGFYDLPAMIDYILEKTGEKEIKYIGHSQGTTMSYVLLSSRPEYNKKIKLVISLAPIAYWKDGPGGQFLKFILANYESFKTFFRNIDVYDVFPLSDKLSKFLIETCSYNIITQSTCAASTFLISGSNPDEFNIKLLPNIFSHLPAGASVQALEHYAQNIRHGTFRQYDHSCDRSNNICVKKRTPLYPLDKITTRVVLMYSTNDFFTREKNVMVLAKLLPNVEVYQIPDGNFNHIDYTWAKNVKDVANDKILKTLSMY